MKIWPDSSSFVFALYLLRTGPLYRCEQQRCIVIVGTEGKSYLHLANEYFGFPQDYFGCKLNY